MRNRAQLWSKQRDVLVVELKRQQGKEINYKKQQQKNTFPTVSCKVLLHWYLSSIVL